MLVSLVIVWLFGWCVDNCPWFECLGDFMNFYFGAFVGRLIYVFFGYLVHYRLVGCLFG